MASLSKLEPLSATMTDRDFARLSELVRSNLGIKMPPAKRVMLQSRLLRRLRELQLGSFAAYREYLERPDRREEELVHFLDLVTTNKTSFFREPVQFQALSATLLPRLTARGSPRTIKVWSAGCSTGAEPYTIAMTLSEHLRNAGPGWDYSIFATDISTRVLARARQAVYPEAEIEPVATALRHRYLLRSKDRGKGLVRIRPELRARVRFQRLNLNEADYDVRELFDLVFCRNVLIYFDRSQQLAILRRLCARLKPGGLLLLGMTETIQDLPLPVEALGSSMYVRTGGEP